MTHPVETPPSDSTSADERVSTLVGDRLCIRCGFNLCGQPVLRERHYRLLIARCPECGQAAALQEYPLLGRWANRWAALLAAAWLGVVVAGVLATAGIITGLAQATAALGSQAYALVIVREHTAWFESLDDAARARYQAWQGVLGNNGPYSMVLDAWWTTADKAAMFRRAGGWPAQLSWELMVMWVWMLIAAGLAGILLAVAMTGARRRTLLLVALGPVGLAALFTFLQYAGTQPAWGWGGGMPAMTHAQKRMGPVIAGATVAFALPCLWAGMVVGRPTARCVVRTFLPPRLRGPLATLWIADGLPPPPAR